MYSREGLGFVTFFALPVELRWAGVVRFFMASHNTSHKTVSSKQEAVSRRQ